MKRRELQNLGLHDPSLLALAEELMGRAREFGLSKAALREDFRKITSDPVPFFNHPLYGELAKRVPKARGKGSYAIKEDLKYNCWGEEIDQEAHRQMENACSLPIAVAGALMPDAHVGYGLPIGGVLATETAVIPYAVGVDIACRVMLTVLDIPLEQFKRRRERFAKVLEENTQFGIGAKWQNRKDHEVMSENWNITTLTRQLKERAWSQLGTSGSGNHFVEFGEFELSETHGGLEPGTYLAVVSHSGSRGPGSKIADYYCRLARAIHNTLPKHLAHLAWLDMNGEGAEYFECMELMGKFASANHHVIHRSILRALNAESLCQVENHHNFAWKEEHEGRQVIVHRKGATPAAKGQFGYIPGTMVAPGYLVEGLGNPASLNSCSHGAGRQMSRKAAKNSMTHYQLNKILSEHGVELISAGLDESPHAYKDIDAVMYAQQTLVRKIGKFLPKLVKMAPEGEKAED